MIPFEQAWMLLKNIGEQPFQNNFPDDHPAMEKQPMAFADFQSTTPPAFALRKPPAGNLVSSTGRLSDIPLAEQQEGMMKPVPPIPMTEEDKALLEQLRMGGTPSTNALARQQ